MSGGSNGVPDYFDRKRDMTALEETALFREAGVTISGSGLGEAERIQAMHGHAVVLRVLRHAAAIAVSSSPRRRASSDRRRSSS